MINYALTTAVLVSSLTCAMEPNNDRFFRAIAHDDITTIKKLLNEGADVQAVHQQSGQTARLTHCCK